MNSSYETFARQTNGNVSTIKIWIETGHTSIGIELHEDELKKLQYTIALALVEFKK